MHLKPCTFSFQTNNPLQVFYDKMKDAQQEIKSTVTVNTSDIAAKAHETKQDPKDFVKNSRKQSE